MDGEPGARAERQQRAAAQSAPTARANLISDGLGKDGKLQLVMNKSTVLTTNRPYKSVSVGQPEIADVTPVSPTNILVTAKKPGTTQVIVWDDQNRTQVADVSVKMDLSALQHELQAMFPSANIEVADVGGSLALRGKVPDTTVAEQAVSAASAYGVKVLNFLEVGGGQQVMLQVKFAEVSRDATSQLGVDFAMSDGIFSLGSNVGQITPSGFTDGTTGALGTQSVGTGVTLFGSGQAGAVAFRYFIQALRQNNLARILAEPNLVAMSGQKASFLAGGEFPVPVPQSGTGGSATITIDYREFGVRLSFVPVVLGDGRIRLKLTPEVSDLDFSSPLVISGSRIPIVNKRTVTTVIELNDGQTFAIAGLLNNSVAASKDVVPGLGDLPVLGALFRSVRYERKETELVVLVTPKIVGAMNPDQVSAVPGEHWRHPSEAQLFLQQDLGGQEEIPVQRVQDRDGKPMSDAGNAAPTTAPSAIAKAAPSTRPSLAEHATTRPAMARVPSTQPAIANAATTQPVVASVPTTAPVAAETATTRPAIAAAPTTEPAVAEAATSQPAVAEMPSTRPAMTTPAETEIGNAPATAPSVAEAPVTEPAVAESATTQPAIAEVPATQPLAIEPAIPSQIAGTATTEPSVVSARAKDSDVANATTQPASVADAQPENAPLTDISTPKPAEVADASSIKVMPAWQRNGPLYHGRHGFTPPAHAPARRAMSVAVRDECSAVCLDEGRAICTFN